MERIFLGWERPALAAVVDYVWNRYTTAGVADLSPAVLVVPGARAGRRLHEALAERAQQQRAAWFPPVVTTVGQLPELLYRRRRPFASALTQQLAWTAALRQTAAGVLGQFLRTIPPTDDDPRWWELGTLLWRQHRELAADGLDFPDVAAAGAQLRGFVDRARWQALAQVQQGYLRQLDQLGLWDRQTARLFAIEHGECQVDRDVWLVGTVDLSRALRHMLDQVHQRVISLVHADPAWQSGFDPYGCLRPEWWRDVEIPLRPTQIRVVERPADQAAEVVRFLAELNGRYSSAEITVGVPDETLVPLIQRGLAVAGVRGRYGPGRTIEATRPVRLLRALIQYQTTERLADLVDVLRHPDLFAWLRRSSSKVASELALLDEYCRQRLVVMAEQVVFGDDPASQGTRRLMEHVQRLLAPLAGPPRRPGDWVPDILGILAEIYEECEIDPERPADRMVLVGGETLRDGLLELQRLPPELTRPVAAREAVLMAISSQARQQVSTPSDPGAVELLGWLELPLDDAPVLAVTQVNEGTIPTSASSDLFLPDTLRAHLGLDDNARRYARDAYALTVLARTREQFAVIVGRRDDQGNPLLPSRLLFATNDEQRRRRCVDLFGDPSARDPSARDAAESDLDSGRTSASTLPAPREQPVPMATHGFYVPRLRSTIKIEALNVTDFKAYLECPYRFYLSRVLALRSVIPQPAELDGPMFGTLLHEILERFGESPVRDSADAEEIGECAGGILDDVFAQRFGAAPRPVVQIQRAQLRLRLMAFAQRQADWRRQGWRIVITEGQRRTVSTRWLVDGEPIELRGRIDRIDQHASGQYAILDYKSSEEGRSPRAAHLVGAGRGPVGPEHWQDLQLPLYRHLVADLPWVGEPLLGFVTLPRALDKTGFQLADWTRQELSVADEAARRVVRKIRDRIFWAPADLDRGFDPGLDRICQIGVFDRQLEPANDAETGGDHE